MPRVPRLHLIIIIIAGVVLAALAPVRTQTPDTFVARLEALALMQTLNADILASRSATLSLERWCRDHRLAEDPTIVARVMKVAARPATAEQRVRLHVSDREPVKYRRVQLRCGDRVLSEAENWYVPGRLTAEMNRLLDTTDTPFGKAIASLEPYRQTFAVRMLWSPLPDGWADDSGRVPAATGRVLVIPDDLFEHRAILYTREHRPVSEVDEVYTGQLLAFVLR